MPVTTQWENEGKTIIRSIYSGDVVLEDYFNAIDDTVALMNEVSHMVDCINDRTDVRSGPANVSSALRYGQTKMPDHHGIDVIVKGTGFTRAILRIAQIVAPRLAKDVYYADSVDEAFEMIEKHGSYAGKHA